MTTNFETACARTRNGALRYRLSRLLRVRHVRLDGFRLIGYRADVPKHVSSLLARGDYEAPERLALQRVLKPGDRVLEIGSCVGVVALTAARIVGDRNVTSYEPNPAAAAVARENFALNGQAITLHNAAIGEASGTLMLAVATGSWLGASAMRGNLGTMHEVAMVAIADAAQSSRPTVLVIDVEGMEARIIPAMPMDGLRAVMIEFHPDVIGENGIAAIRAHLRNHGFQSRGDLKAAATEVWERPSL